MDFKEVIPITALRKFDEMCLHNEYLHENKELPIHLYIKMYLIGQMLI